MNQEDQIHALFPAVLQISDLDNADVLNARLLQSIYDIKATTPNAKPPGWCCDLYTTIRTPYGLLEREEFADIRNIFKEKVIKYASALRYDVARHPPRLNECWVNVYDTTNSQEVHRHPNSVFSGIYYVKAPPGSAPTLFHSEVSDVMLDPPIMEQTPLNSQVTPVEARPGRMVVFRSWLRHSVLPSQINEDRVTIAFNATM
ncbi:MAG: hypothetical protein CMO26_20860 [Thiotrichales bacterium]|nr:hypothetical protein [Thiotrichales bacterium]